MARAIRAAVAGAVADTGLEPDCVLMDGNPLGAVPNERDVVKGDAKIACIAAASIMAKVTRDEMMVEYDAEYPEYIWPSRRATQVPSTSRRFANMDFVRCIV